MFLQQKILINRDEDISSIVEKLVSSWGDEIFLIVPDKARIFGRISDVQIIKEEAGNLKKHLAVITPDARGQKICLDVGLPVMDLDRIEVTKERMPLEVDEPKKVFDIAPHRPQPAAVEESAPSVSWPMQPEEEPAEEMPSGLPVEEEVSAEEKPEEEYRYEPYTEEPGEREETKMPERKSRPDWLMPEEEVREKERKISDFFKKFRPVRRVGGLPLKTRILVSFVGAAAVIFLAALILVLPKAQIVIETQKEEIIFDFSLSADAKQINVEKGLIPGQIIGPISREKTVYFNATGRKFLEEKARGKILVFNAYSSASQVLVQNTRFLSKEGKLFRLTRAITVPGAAVDGGRIVPRSIEAEVIADQIGEDYNIGPTAFTIPGFQGSPKFNGFYGESRSAMTGGAKGEVTVATRDDIEKAKAEVFKTLSDIIDKDFSAKLPAGLAMVDGAKETKVAEQTVSTQPDTRADKFSVTLRMTISAFLFAESDLRVLIQELAAQKLGADKEIIPDKEEIIYKKAQPDFSKGIMRLDVEARETIQSKLDIDRLKQDLVGRSQSELESLLSTMPSLENSLVKLWPFWTKSVPKNPDKIEIIVK